MKMQVSVSGAGGEVLVGRFPRTLLLGAAAMALGFVLTVPWEKVSAAEADKTPPKPAETKRKPWSNAWAPNKPLRGIIINYWDALQGAELREPWLGFCDRNGLAWCQGGAAAFEALADVAAELGHPELVNAPVIWAGLSAGGLHGILFAQAHPDRVLAVIGTVPVTPFVKGNEGFNFNRPKFKGLVREHDTDVSRTLGVPMFIQTGPRDPICGSALAYGFFKYGRRQGAPWTYYCMPNASHGGNKNEVVMPWLDMVLAQRLPADADLRQGSPKLKPIKVEDGWLGHTQTLTIDGYSKYDGDKAKASWLPDQAAAEAWKKYGLGMPYEFPEQPLRQPSGLIGDLVVHDPRGRIIAPDAIYGDAWKIVANQKEGDTYCLTQDDRFCQTVVGRVSDLVRGCDWVKPDGLAVDFTGKTLLEFTLSDDAVVYVGHDEEIVKKPAWLADWKDTGEFVLGGYLGTEHSFRLFEKVFPKNATVKLGPNGERPKDVQGRHPQGWIYMTIVKRSCAR